MSNRYRFGSLAFGKDITCKRFAVWSRCSYFFQRLDGFRVVPWCSCFIFLGAASRSQKLERKWDHYEVCDCDSVEFTPTSVLCTGDPKSKKDPSLFNCGVAKTWWWTNINTETHGLSNSAAICLLTKLGIKLHLSTQCEVFNPYLVLHVVCSTIVSTCVTSKANALDAWDHGIRCRRVESYIFDGQGGWYTIWTVTEHTNPRKIAY